MAHIYPYTWEPLSEEEDATVKQCYGHLGHCRELVRCHETISFTTAHVLNTILPEKREEEAKANKNDHWNVLIEKFEIKNIDEDVF